MDNELYKAAKEGNVEVLRDIGEPDEYFHSKTNGDNNIIHIAARHGHASFTKKALRRFSLLGDQPNSKGDTPLHVAASHGHLNVVKVLVLHYQEQEKDATLEPADPTSKLTSSGDIEHGSEEPVRPRLLQAKELAGKPSNHEDGRTMEAEPQPVLEDASCLPWLVRNLEGSIPLHQSLRKGSVKVSLYLLNLDSGMASFVNGAGESPLYLAAESRCDKVVKKILGLESYSLEGPHGQSPLHAAKYCSKKTISLLLEKIPGLTTKQDELGKTALHYAVEEDLFWLLPSLLKNGNLAACLLSDVDGLTPLLRACTLGCFSAAKQILKLCPQSIEARDKNGRNALHLSPIYRRFGQKSVLDFAKEAWEIINEADDEGNTPLHLAIQNRDYVKAALLLKMKTIDLGVINKKGLTALDTCESQDISELDGLGDWLQKAVLQSHLIKRSARRGRLLRRCIERVQIGERSRAEKECKEAINTLALVAALLATVSFTATFTMPGGYGSADDGKLGVPVLLKKPAFKAFLWLNTSAMSWSVVALFSLMWAMITRGHNMMLLTSFGVGLIYSSVVATLLAFAANIYATVALGEPEIFLFASFMAAFVAFLCRDDGALRFAARQTWWKHYG